MFYALSWFVVLSLFLLWSLAAWAFHAVAAWTVTHAGGLAAGAGPIAALQVPAWLAPWVPPEYAVALNSMVASIGPYIEGLMAWAPTLTGGLSIAVWTIWGIGTFLLIVIGFLATGLIAFLRRRASTTAASSTSLAAAR